ncbi:MAG: alpha/beta hydrolase [Rhizobiales bacterium]|nr:alpha/beta hydrolase [Hyphomicrobiales bacterium]
MYGHARPFLWLHVLLVVAALSGCGGGGRHAHELLKETSVPAAAGAIAGKHDIFVATTRSAASDKREVYSGGRAAELGLVKIGITVPAIHKIGAIERPSGKKANPAKFFTATSVTAYDPESFKAALRADLARHDGRALIFIHGFNTRFDDAVYRMTQLVHDADYQGTPVLFSWASAGSITDYFYDTNSATIARDRLEATLRMLVAAGAKRVDIIAHSMGNWVTMEALRQLAITHDKDLDGRLGDVLLASPDIDIDVFKSQMARYGKPRKPFVVMLSGDDRALLISRLLAGNKPRVGDYGDAKDLAQLGVVVVNVSAIASGDRLNHSKFADNPVLVRLLGQRLNGSGDSLATSNEQFSDKVGQLTAGIGGVVTKAADIIITTPLKVVTIAVGG